VSQPIGQRVVSANILCRECDVPEYQPLDVNKMYRIISPSWIGSGGNGFTMFGEHRQNIKKGILDIDVVEKYIKKITPIVYGHDGRIKIVK
jgi:5'-nucleotidase